MSDSIIDRLAARIAAKPDIDHIDTLFADLQDAHDTIATAAAQNLALKDQIASMAAAGSGEEAEPSASVKEAITLLKDGKARLAVNALSDVGLSMDGAIKLLEG